MTQRRAELISAAALGALGLAMCLYSIAEYPFRSESSIGPGVLPVISGGLLIVSAGAVALAARRRPHSSVEPAPASPAESSDATVPSETQLAMRVLGLSVVATLLTSVAGFVLAFSGLIFALLVLVERKPKRIALAAAVGAAVVTWFLFVYLLKIPLPTGLL